MTDEQRAIVEQITAERDALAASHRTHWQARSDSGRVSTVCQAFFRDLDDGVIKPDMTDMQVYHVVRSGIGTIILWWIGKEFLWWCIQQLIRRIWPDRSIGVATK